MTYPEDGELINMIDRYKDLPITFFLFDSEEFPLSRNIDFLLRCPPEKTLQQGRDEEKRSVFID